LAVQLFEPVADDGSGSNGNGAQDRLWLLSPDVPPRPLADGPLGTGLDWSPAGDGIAFIAEGRIVAPEDALHAALEGAAPDMRHLVNSLCVLDVSSGNVRVLKTDATAHYALRWSPDGTAIASGILWRKATGFRAAVAITGLTSGSTRFVVLGSEDAMGSLDVAWSRDGQHILVRAGGAKSGQDLHVVDLASGANRVVYSAGRRAFSFMQLLFDERNEMACFVSYELSQPNESAVLYGCDLSTGEVQEIARLILPEGHMLGVARASPDARGLAATQGSPGNGVLWCHGGRSGTIAPPEPDARMTGVWWSSDSNHLAVSYRGQSGEMVAVYELP
jgi:hypothetical protein